MEKAAPSVDTDGASFNIPDALDKKCAYLMSCGMSYEDYWHGDPKMARFFAEAERLRIEKQNTMMHLLGAYVYRAIGAYAGAFTSPLIKDPKIEPYLSDKLPITKHEVEEAKKREKERAIEAYKEFFLRWNGEIEAKKEKEEVEDDGGI